MATREERIQQEKKILEEKYSGYLRKLTVDILFEKPDDVVRNTLNDQYDLADLHLQMGDQERSQGADKPPFRAFQKGSGKILANLQKFGFFSLESLRKI